jgi:hypothetical protein
VSYFFGSGQFTTPGLSFSHSRKEDTELEQKEKITVMFTDKYDHTVLSHFIADRDYCAQADTFIKKTLANIHPAPHEIICDCLFWKTRELPMMTIKGDMVDTTRALMIYEGKGLVEFVFNSTKYHYSICRLHDLHRVERTDYSLIIVTQNAVVPCAEITIFGKYQFNYRLSMEGYKEVEELDRFLGKLRELMLK